MKRIRFVLLFLIVAMSVFAVESDPLQRTVSLPKQKKTVYELLNSIGELAGYSFIYDSKITDNDRKVKMPAGSYSVREAVFQVLGSSSFSLKVVDKYILIDKSVHQTIALAPVSAPADSLSGYLNISGIVLDRLEETPISDCFVSIVGTSIGTIANADGRFALKIPQSFKDSSLHVSHIGFMSRRIPLALFAGSHCSVYLDQRIVPLQELIVRMVNPVRIVQEAVESRDRNYSREPVYITSFYREGVLKKKDLVYLTEAVFKVFKPACTSSADDQMKLLKMRKISNQSIKDTVMLKMQAGPNASLMLDLMKNIPDFMEIGPSNSFNYWKIDMVECDSHLAHVVAFEPKEEVNEPSYRGKLYIDADNSALLRAEFEVSPKHLDQSVSLFIVKQGKGMQIRPQQIIYTVSYKAWNGRYYINHLRGDLSFKIKSRRQLFSNPMHMFFESATCKIDTMDVKPFEHDERMQTRKILGDVEFSYDNAFWEDFNIILPQEALTKALGKIISRIEATEE